MDSLRNNGGFSDEFNGGDEAAHAGIELNLGLSFNGKFGVDRTKEGFQIDRSWPLLSLSPVGEGGGSSSSRFLTPTVVVTTPARTYSLPPVAEVVNWQKGKEVHTMSRREGIRRRICSPRLGKAGDDSKDTVTASTTEIHGITVTGQQLCDF